MVQDEAQHPAFAMEMTRWASYLTTTRTILDFPDLASYERYVREVEPRTLKGELVRSCEECEIGNFIYLNGINYEYEARHPTAPTASDREPYQPDFFLKDYDIFIEHWALDEHGRTPPFIDQAKYTKDMEWKRAQYDGEKRKLVETYSYEKRNGTLLRKLEDNLKNRGVRFQPRVGEDPLQRLRELGQIDRFSKLLCTFLGHVKSSQHSMEWLHERAASSPDVERARSFLILFERVYERYNQYLEERGEIDFHDMVNKAAEYATSGRFNSPYRFIVVDEFQDISRSLARLVLALVNQRKPEARLFCVGDDWQAIYRFAGADLSVMQSMEEIFGHTKRLFLAKTFRFNSAIAQVSSKFILKNEAQIKKQVVPASVVSEPCVFVIPAGSPSSRPLRTIFRIIAEKVKGSRCEVLVLSRYSQFKTMSTAGYLNEELNWWKEQGKSEYPNGIVRCDTRKNHRGEVVRTIHSVKGLEADFVIVVGLCHRLYGFPCEIMGDPIIDIVLAKSDPFPHAEERRLFYVALTRAKKAAFLVTDSKNPSTFVSELESEDHLVQRIDEAQCSECREGVLVPRKGPHGEFLGCSNYPACRNTKPI
ncbi:TPA: hypothetical protein DCY67_00685 [Candidatus Acetothermia bacterium]|nr:hypothetical protein [Candidatus Acetothermia bacterium]